MTKNNLTRRGFLTSGAAIGVSAAGLTGSGGAAAREIEGGEPWLPHQADAPHPEQSSDYIFLSPAEVAFVEAATERIIPHDELGPGAKDCRVALFIDHQLVGAYGRGQRWYMQGPWKKGEKTQGFQSRLGPADLYRAAIKAIDAHVSSGGKAKTFAALSETDQDALLSDMESGKLKLEGADAKTFFEMLLLNTKEGMFSDPIYGGNKDMAGWKMLGFPGARYNYLDWVERHGERYDQPPVGLSGRPAWTVQKS
ncbi:MAG: gluconate 2-dehydrogenase subunit 3 family protein [Pararhizobium sp.]